MLYTLPYILPGLEMKSRWVGGGVVFELRNPEGRGGRAQAVLEIQVEGRGVQKYAFHWGCVWIFLE